VGVAIASSLCERVLVFGGHYATPGITRTDTVPVEISRSTAKAGKQNRGFIVYIDLEETK
jgi:hypothetical protein